MRDAARLHFFCGKMAAGKSTLANALSEEHQAVLIVEDDWLGTLYPNEITTIPDYIRCSSRLKTILRAHIEAILREGVSVVLDFPANTVEQRKWFKSLIENTGVAHVLHFIDATDDVCKQQLRLRSAGMPEGTAFTRDAEFDAITRYFQAPEAGEGFNVVTYRRDTSA